MPYRPVKPGDRVRVTVRSHIAGYQPGDKGTIRRVFKPSSGDECYYYVEIDKDDAARSWTIFAEGEIEAEV